MLQTFACASLASEECSSKWVIVLEGFMKRAFSSCRQDKTRLLYYILANNTVLTRCPFLESPGNFSGPQSLNNIWNLTIVELFYSDILIMNRDSLHTRSFRRIHFSVFRYTDDLKMALRARKSFRVFRESGPRQRI